MCDRTVILFPSADAFSSTMLLSQFAVVSGDLGCQAFPRGSWLECHKLNLNDIWEISGHCHGPWTLSPVDSATDRKRVFFHVKGVLGETQAFSQVHGTTRSSLGSAKQWQQGHMYTLLLANILRICSLQDAQYGQLSQPDVLFVLWFLIPPLRVYSWLWTKTGAFCVPTAHWPLYRQGIT